MLNRQGLVAAECSSLGADLTDAWIVDDPLPMFRPQGLLDERTRSMLVSLDRLHSMAQHRWTRVQESWPVPVPAYLAPIAEVVPPTELIGFQDFIEYHWQTKCAGLRMQIWTDLDHTLADDHVEATRA